MKVDPEVLVYRVIDYLKANLNTAIAAMNAEKADDTSILTVADQAYHVQTLNNEIVNTNPYLILGIDYPSSSSVGPATLKVVSVEVALILADDGALDIARKMFRYGRVLEELFNNGFEKIHPNYRFKVNSLVPIPIRAIDSNDPYRAVGVEIVTQLG